MFRHIIEERALRAIHALLKETKSNVVTGHGTQRRNLQIGGKMPKHNDGNDNDNDKDNEKDSPKGASMNLFQLAGAVYKDDIKLFALGNDISYKKFKVHQVNHEVDENDTTMDMNPISCTQTTVATTTTCDAVEELIKDLGGKQSQEASLLQSRRS